MQAAAMFLGRIIGVLIGVRFGPPGILLGFLLGWTVDRWLARQGRTGWAPWRGRQQLFTDSVTALAAKLAKIDGPVSRAEVDAFKAEFQIPPGQLRAVGQIFDRAKQSAAGYEDYARRLGQGFADAPVLLAGVLDALRRIAVADGPIQPAESEFLARVANAFRLVRPGAGAGAHLASGEDDPYATLGIARSATTDEVKAAWRDLVRQHHPDALIAKGLPKEYVDLATRKMAAINAAWDRIRAERGET
jgi:DnaJ like chaperone protein